VNPFDPTGRCPKCGHDEVRTNYQRHAHGWGCKDHCPPHPRCCRFEHLDRCCQRCYYVWAEACLGPREGEVG